MKHSGLAFDFKSARSIDADGRLHVSKTNISKAVVNPYYGKEIPGWQERGLIPDKVYRLYRDPEELSKGASSFNNLPILDKHIPVNSGEPQQDRVVGSIGSDVTFDAPYLQASLCVWVDRAIAGIESKKLCELSMGYRYTPDMTPGVTPDGEEYDGVMRDIIGNHLALVEVGRAGPDVVVADSNPFHNPKETPAMKMSKLGKALFVSLRGLSPTIAQDAAFAALVGDAKKETFNKQSVRESLIAMDADIDAEKVDEILDAVLGIEEQPEAVEPKKEVAEDGDDLMQFLSGKLSPEDLEAVKGMMQPKAADGEPPVKPEDVNEKVTAAMDSMRSEFRQLEQAKSEVRSVVGDVIGMDSAEQVYRFALDNMGVDHKDMPAAGLKSLFTAVRDRTAKRTTIAQDSSTSAETVKAFGLGRFGRA